MLHVKGQRPFPISLLLLALEPTFFFLWFLPQDQDINFTFGAGKVHVRRPW